jgi:hypothetical protein
MDTQSQWELALLSHIHRYSPAPTTSKFKKRPEYDYLVHGLSVILFASDGMFSLESWIFLISFVL